MIRMCASCPLCGGRMEMKMAEVQVSYRSYTKTIKVNAYICQKCGERIYTPEAEAKIRQVEEEMRSADQYFE